MFEKISRHLNRRTLVVAIAVVILVWIGVIFYPSPISEEQLTQNAWCSISLPSQIHWDFAETGEFYSYIRILSPDADYGYGGGQGEWDLTGSTIVVRYTRDAVGAEYTDSFTIRPMAGGKLLRAWSDFGDGAYRGPMIWESCG